MSRLGDLVVDDGVTFVVTFDGRQSLLGVRRSMGPLIASDDDVRRRQRRQAQNRQASRRYAARKPRPVLRGRA